MVDLGMGCPTQRTRPNPTRPEEFDGRARVKNFDPVGLTGRARAKNFVSKPEKTRYFI